MQDPAGIARGLDEIAGFLLFSGAPRFKVQAYQHAVQVVRTLDHELAPLVEQSRLREIDGIGDGLSRQIQELWNCGTTQFLERLRQEHPAGAAELIHVPGMSARRIRALDAALGIHSVEQLREACLAERVRGVPGFGAKTEQKLLDACERWSNARRATSVQPLLLPRALELAQLISDHLASRFERLCFAGALRRGAETSNELLLLVVGSQPQAFRELRALRQVLRIDEARSVALLSDGVELSIHTCAARDWGGALVRATGDASHVAALDARATARGLSLREACFAEEDLLYRAVGLPLIPPELRYGAGGIQRAERGSLHDLLELPQIQGLVHCHTNYSDGKQSVLEMATAAHELGMQYITITDHSASAHYARGVPVDRLKQQWDEIAAAQEQVPIRILRGTESDILRDGGLDYPDAILEAFDVVIASIHARYRMSRAEMTERLVRAMAMPWFKIWGHGLGRILNHREPIDCDVPAVLEALARGGGAVELNADPHRLDLPPEWLPAASALGIPVVVSVDAHSTRGFGVLRYGVTMARRAGLKAAEVLNTLPAAEFAARVRPVPQR
jgi:DNA polymerase (family X)